MLGVARRCMLSLGVVLAAVLLLSLSPDQTNAAINPQINFQGKLTNPDGTNVTNGTYSIVFGIYSAASGGVAIWTETQGSVTITDGIFQVSLGSVTALPGSVDFNSASLFLGIKVGADAEMTPRVQFSSTPYSFNSDLLDGVNSTGFVQLGQSASAQADASTNSSIFINKTAAGNLLQLQASASNVLTLSSVGALGLTGSLTTSGGAISLTGNAASSVTTSTGALTFTGAAASTWSTTAGNLTIQAGSGTVSLGSSTVLTATGALSLTSGTATTLTLDSGTTGAINIGTSANAKTITIGNFTGATGVAFDVGAGTNVFNIQGPGSVNLFQIDSTNNMVYIGNPTADATGVVFVLDTKNSAGDPTGVVGAMYYNSSTNTFRCYENGAWKDCLGKKRVFLTADDANTNGTANTLEDIAQLTFPVLNGSSYGFECNIMFTAAATTTGSRFSINGPATSALSYSSYYPNNATTTADIFNFAQAAYNLPAGASANSPASARAAINGRATFSANGSVVVRFASEVASSAITAKTNSWCDYWVQ